MDNAILTSFRTLSKQNNVVTNTFKIVHDKFTPFTAQSGEVQQNPSSAAQTKRLRKKYNQEHNKLYEVKELHQELDNSNFGQSKFEASLNLMNKDGQIFSSFEIKELESSKIEFGVFDQPSTRYHYGANTDEIGQDYTMQMSGYIKGKKMIQKS